MQLKSVRRVVFFVASFGFGRGALFAAPIVLANLLEPAEYGTLEFVQALASIFSVVLGLGTASLVPLILVRQNQTISFFGVLAHQTGCATFLALLAVGAYFFRLSSVVGLTTLAVGALMLQLLWSSTLRSNGRGEASLIVDAGFWGGLALVAFVVSVLTLDSRVRWLAVVGGLIGYFLVLLCVTLLKGFCSYRSGDALRYKETVGAGVPLMIGTLLSFLATTSGRLGIGLLATPEVTAQYAMLFRATAIPMVAHQMIMVSQFRQIFALSEHELQYRLPMISVLVTSSVLVFWLFSGLIGVVLGPAFDAVFALYPKVALLILAQCILWSGIAINETLNNRAQTAGRMIFPAIVYFILAFALSWCFLTSQGVELEVFVPVHSLVMVGYFLVQVVVMCRCKLYFVRTWVATLLSFLGVSALTQLI